MAKKVAGAECSDDDEASRRCGAEGEHCWLASLLVVVSRLFANHHIHRFCDSNLNKILKTGRQFKESRSGRWVWTGVAEVHNVVRRVAVQDAIASRFGRLSFGHKHHRKARADFGHVRDHCHDAQLFVGV